MTVAKCSSGYGFTIKGSMPVRVGRVKPSGAAENAGLRNGDYILNINDKDITSSTVEAIANIVRNSTNQLQIQIARGQRSKDPKSPRCLPKSSFTISWVFAHTDTKHPTGISSHHLSTDTAQTAATGQSCTQCDTRKMRESHANVDAAREIYSNWSRMSRLSSRSILGDRT